jgi:methylthioribulose-1-phosphate dehydratase
MAFTYDDLDARVALARIATEFHRRGWMPGTAGNLSARAANAQFWITASGLPKGGLDAQDFILVDVAGGETIERQRPGQKPSAETSIHRAVYRLFPEARACFHVHSVDACVALSRLGAERTSVRLPPLEVIKAFDIWEQEPAVELDLFSNWLDVPAIANEIEARYRANPPRLSALAIRDHGITVWGDSLQAAFNRTEVVEFIMSYMARSGAPS